MVTDLCSIGTLFAFVLVCAGVLVLQNKPNIPRGKFKTPYVNSKYIFPFLLVVGCIVSFTKFQENTISFITNKKQINSPETIITSLNNDETKAVNTYMVKLVDTKNTDIEKELNSFLDKDAKTYQKVIDNLPIDSSKKYETGFSLFKHKIPMWIFFIALLCFAILFP